MTPPPAEKELLDIPTIRLAVGKPQQVVGSHHLPITADAADCVIRRDMGRIS